jgi:hypothetical protein
MDPDSLTGYGYEIKAFAEIQSQSQVFDEKMKNLQLKNNIT